MATPRAKFSHPLNISRSTAMLEPAGAFTSSKMYAPDPSRRREKTQKPRVSVAIPAVRTSTGLRPSARKAA
eukprot:1520550-Prymnesium_polylepis.1